MDYDSTRNGAGTDADQGETDAVSRVNYESLCSTIKNQGAHLYFIKVTQGRGAVKIGRANRPDERLKALQVACPYTLKLLGVLENCGDYECGWHSFLGHERLRGEWFRWTKVVEETVKLALDGGDWREVISKRRYPRPEGDWFIGSPLYESA